MFSSNFLTGSSDASAAGKAHRRRYDNIRDTRPQTASDGEQNILKESMGYAKNMRNLREELKMEMEVLRNDLKDNIASCLADTRLIMKDVNDNIGKLEEVQSGELLKVEFLTVREEVRSGLEYVSKSIEEQLSENTSHLLSEISVLRQHQEDSEQSLVEEMHKVQFGCSNLESLVSHSAAQITELLNEQHSVSAEAFTEIRLISEDSSKYQDVLTTNLDHQLRKHLHHQAVNVDFSQVLGKVEASQWKTSDDIRLLHTEIAKIQQELNLDFAEELFNKAVESMHATAFRRSSGGSAGSTAPPATDFSSRAAFRKSISMMKAQGLGLPGLADAEPELLQGDESRPLSQPALPPPSAPQEGAHAGIIRDASSDGSRRSAKRVRHYWSQTDSSGIVEQGMQTDMVPKRAKARPNRGRPRLNNKSPVHSISEVGVTNLAKREARPMIADMETLKRQARENMMKPQYNVFDDYWESGFIQLIAKSSFFQNTTFFVIFLNTIWIGIDLDYNDAAVLSDAHPIFQVCENIFCTYFTLELIIRFVAFRQKRWCLRDWWFIFDSVLVALMVAETWIVFAMMKILGVEQGSDLGPVSMLRVVRMCKMVRMARMVRLVRFFPELVVLLKGIKAAIRSVFVFFLLWLILIYVYAVIFKQTTADKDIGRQYFDSIPAAMNTLLLRGILPDFAMIMDDVSREDPWLWPILLSFIVLGSLTMMNMLTGVLVEVVSVLSAVEKESMTVGHVSIGLRQVMAHLQQDTDADLTHAEFRHLLVNPEVAAVVQDVGVDVVAVLDQSDLIFETIHQDSGESTMTFEKFIDTVLNMRTTNSAKLKDISCQVRLIGKMIKESSDRAEENLSRQIASEMVKIRSELGVAVEQMQKAVIKGDDDDDDDLQSEYGDTGESSFQVGRTSTTPFSLSDSKDMPETPFDESPSRTC